MKRIISILFILLISSNFTFGQLEFLFGTSPLKLIEKGEYADAEKKISTTLLKSPDDMAANYAMAMLLKTRKYTSYNAEKSYEYLSKCRKIFDNTKDEQQLKKFNKVPINQVVLLNFSDTVSRLAMEDAFVKNNVETFEKYLDFYQLAPDIYKKKVIESRDLAAYKVANEKNTLESYQHFISRYPDAVQFADATTKRNVSAFQKARTNDNIESYKDFVQRYPAANEVVSAWERIHELAYVQAEKENTSIVYKKFIDDYPLSKQYTQAFAAYEKRQYLENVIVGDWNNYRAFIEKFPTNSWKAVAEDSIYSLGTKSENLDILRYCLDHFTGDKRKNALVLYHDIFTLDGEKLTLDMFYEKYKDDFLNQVKLKDYEMATLSDQLLLQMPYVPSDNLKYDNYIKMAAPRDKAFTALQKMISVDIETKAYQAAILKIKNYLGYFGRKNKKLLDLISFLETR
ncbi:MAG: hypothetical protein WCG93_10805 [Paludibacter sp.]